MSRNNPNIMRYFSYSNMLSFIKPKTNKVFGDFIPQVNTSRKVVRIA